MVRVEGEFETDLLIERIDSVLRCRRVHVAHKVRQHGVVGEGDENMSKSLGDIERLAILRVELHRVPLAERRRTEPDVHHEIEDGAGRDCDVFRLAAGHIRKVYAAHGPSSRDGEITLPQVERMSDRLLEAIEAVPLEEGPAIVPVDDRRHFVRVWNSELADLHVQESNVRVPLRLSQSDMRGRPAHMKLLVTGGAGFIGSNFVRRTLQDAYPGLEGAHVVVLDALTYSGNLENLAPVAASDRFTFIKGDIRDGGLLDELLPGIDAIVHFAAESHVDRSVRDSSIFVETNVLGTQRLLDAALRNATPRFLHVSTDEVYGSIETGSWTEDRPLEPNSPYSASKAGSDLLVRSYVRTHGLNASITRCSNNYGPYHFPEKVIPLFVTNLLDDHHVPLYGDGLNVRDWLHVDDHTRAIALVLVSGRPGEIYNIGGGTELTNRELTELLLEATGKDWSSVDQVADRIGHDLRYSVDITKISQELGYAPLVPFQQGLAAVVAWYRDNRDWWEPLKARAGLDS